LSIYLLSDTFHEGVVNLPQIKVNAIGEPTAKTITKLNGTLVFTSNSSYGDDFAKEIYPELKGKKVLFLRAKKVLSNLENILKNNGINLKSEVVYETTCKENKPLHVENKNSIFIFTSPSTVECFFSNYEWHDTYQAVCIGTVTAKALPKNISLHVSKVQSIQSCIKIAKTLSKIYL